MSSLQTTDAEATPESFSNVTRVISAGRNSNSLVEGNTQDKVFYQSFCLGLPFFVVVNVKTPSFSFAQILTSVKRFLNQMKIRFATTAERAKTTSIDFSASVAIEVKTNTSRTIVVKTVSRRRIMF